MLKIKLGYKPLHYKKVKDNLNEIIMYFYFLISPVAQIFAALLVCQFSVFTLRNFRVCNFHTSVDEVHEILKR